MPNFNGQTPDLKNPKYWVQGIDLAFAWGLNFFISSVTSVSSVAKK